MPEPTDLPDLFGLPLFADPAPSTPQQDPSRTLRRDARGRRAAAPDALPALPDIDTATEPSAVSWETVSQLRATVSTQITSAFESDPNLSERDQQALAQTYIADTVRTHADTQAAVGGPDRHWNDATIRDVQRQIFDSLFKLGRLQRLVDEAGVENIDLYGADNVWVTKAGGVKEQRPPIYSSDADMIADIAFLAQRGGESGRAFTPSNAILDMDLPGNARLAAVHPPISPRPKAVIRIHRYVDISLDDLVKTDTLTQLAADFLAAAVSAGQSIVVAGMPGAGKTTLTRALANCIEPTEEIVTIEKERELHLDRMGDRHHIVTALQYRPGQGEISATGDRAGEVRLVDLLEEALRLNAERIIVGEVRGAEIDAMFQAMQAGVGSMSTIHASSPDDTIERMAGLTLRNLGTTDAYAYRQITQHIGIIVQIRKARDAQGRTVRRVTHIAQVQPGETTASGVVRPVAADIFRTNPFTNRLELGTLPTEALLDQLDAHGFARDRFTTPGGPA